MSMRRVAILAVRHCPPHRDAVGWSDGCEAPRVVVVGGGHRRPGRRRRAGRAGVRVDVVERERHLGGRVGGWTETLADGSPVA